MAIAYKGIKWFKEVYDLKKFKKEVRDKYNNYEISDIQMFIDGQYGYLKLYNCLSNSYECMADNCYLDNEYSEITKYVYLSGIALLITKCLFQKGIEPEYHRIIKRKMENIDYALFQLIATDARDCPYLYIEKDNLIMHMVHQRYEEAGKILETMPDEIDESRGVYTDNPAYLKQMFLTIINRDEEAFNDKMEKHIKQCRKNMVGYLTIIDVVSIALIKLAREVGIKCTVDVIEIPKLFFDDAYNIDKEKVKLPFYDDFLAKYKDII